jgi:hypothetical protein
MMKKASEKAFKVESKFDKKRKAKKDVAMV